MISFHSFLHWRVPVLGWLTIWITTLPLFHIHVPDTTDRWSALQSGGAHTVFTPDLPGEYSRPSQSEQGHASQLSERAVNSPELGLAIFDDPDDRKSKATPVLAARFSLCEPSLRVNSILGTIENLHPLQPFQALSASRAPPHQIV